MSAPAPFQHDDLITSSLAELLTALPHSSWVDGGVAAEVWEDALLKPAREILSRTGKGFRGRFVEHSWSLGGGDPEALPPLLPVVVELLHAGSLVIDDIEDDSHMRRGAPALHRLYGVPIALNTGNWLYFLSLSLMSRLPFDAERRIALLEDVTRGLLRCHQGQALDVSVRVTSTPRVEISSLVATTTRLKTGALLGLASGLGARGAGASPRALDSICAFGTEVGVALQMLDDWSGIHVEARRTKGIEDLRNARPTWPWAWLAEGTDQVTFMEMMGRARRATIDWELEQVRERLYAHLSSVAPEKIACQFDVALSHLAEAPVCSDRFDAVRADLDALARAYD